ncbi:MAG: hypothetical protein IJU52_04665 [Clostridia bacterium]|nr:hypothetical protein [Clostridia bacterium]
MKKTYVLRMPDEAGALLGAARLIAEEGGNIVRANYNKALDLHTLFVEVNAGAAQHETICARLSACGYLPEEVNDGRILMIVLTLKDEAGALAPVLEIIGRYRINISYISYAESDTPEQYFKMGLLLRDDKALSDMIEEISKICAVRILDYEVTDRPLDGTVFYVSFANEMRRILSLDQETTNEVLIHANRMMQILDEQKKSPMQTFDYIRRFAEQVVGRKGDSYNARVSSRKLPDGVTLYLIEPPCGSNTYVLKKGRELLFVDGGFPCYGKELLTLLGVLIPDFALCAREAFITHADVDHVGSADLFEKTYMCGECGDNFALQREGKADFREQYLPHAPYCALSKIIAAYRPPDPARCQPLGRRSGDDLFCPVGKVEKFGRTFVFYEGSGGHVKGETVIVSPDLGVIFTGDIYVNVKGFSEEQRAFNALAPFLMTGVDVDPALCRKERKYLLAAYKGYLFCPGHGAWTENK